MLGETQFQSLRKNCWIAPSFRNICHNFTTPFFKLRYLRPGMDFFDIFSAEKDCLVIAYLRAQKGNRQALMDNFASLFFFKFLYWARCWILDIFKAQHNCHFIWWTLNFFDFCSIWTFWGEVLRGVPFHRFYFGMLPIQCSY